MLNGFGTQIEFKLTKDDITVPEKGGLIERAPDNDKGHLQFKQTLDNGAYRDLSYSPEIIKQMQNQVPLDTSPRVGR